MGCGFHSFLFYLILLFSLSPFVDIFLSLWKTINIRILLQQFCETLVQRMFFCSDSFLRLSPFCITYSMKVVIHKFYRRSPDLLRMYTIEMNVAAIRLIILSHFAEEQQRKYRPYDFYIVFRRLPILRQFQLWHRNGMENSIEGVLVFMHGQLSCIDQAKLNEFWALVFSVDMGVPMVCSSPSLDKRLSSMKYSI